MDWNEMQKRLVEPFPAKDVMFRPGAPSPDRKRAQALPYAEPRVYEDRLNKVLGPDWSCRFKTWGDQRLICELTIQVTHEDGTIREITRTSTGEFDNGDKIAQGTVAEAQAFKRACSKFGLGRYLYDIPISWVGYDEGSRRLTERPGPGGAALVKTTPTLPQRFHQQPEPVRLTAHRASLLHKELGRLSTITSQEHQGLAGEALSRTVDSFTGLTDDEALRVLNHVRRVDHERRRARHVNPERQGGEQRLRA
jgi:hypothetical protein